VTRRASARGTWSTLLRLCASLLACSATGCTYVIAAVAVSLSGDGGSSGGSFGAPAPQVTSVSPGEASHMGGVILQVEGLHFSPDSTVVVGDQQASQVTYVDPQTLEVLLPRSAASGPVDLKVANPSGGVGTLGSALVYTNELPSLTATELASPQSGNIVIAFTVSDPESDALDVTLELDAGSGWNAIPASAIVSGAVSSLESSPQAVSHSITFDSSDVFPQQDVDSVRLCLTPIDRTDGEPGTPGVSNAFAIENNVPVQVHLVRPGDDAYRVVLDYRVVNVDSQDAVQVTSLRWHDLKSGQSGPLTVVSGQGLGDVPSSPQGESVRTVWDSLADVGYGNNRLVQVSAERRGGSRPAAAP